MHLSRVRPALCAALAAILVLLLVPALAAAAPPTSAIPLDGTQEISGIPVPFQVFPNGQPSGPLAQAFALEGHGDPDLILTLYDQSGIPEHAGPYQVPFWKEYVGEHSDVYVAWDDLAAVPESSYQDQTVTPEQIAYLGEQFDTRIWASDVAHFGWYDFRAPEEGMDGSRAAIMVYNIRDEGYWGDYPFYIAGYFWGGLNDEIQMNCIFVDSYNWADRVGGDVARPYLYEGTIAHEFQHLIHSDVDGDEDSFIDEGMASMAAQFIYGPSASSSDFAYALYYHRDSLTDWDGELYDYGNTQMWQDYLWETASRGDGDAAGDLFAPLSARIKDDFSPFDNTADKFVDPGDAFIWNEIHDPANGLQGVADQVAGGMAQVERLHRDWTLANLLDGKVSEPQWNYDNFVLGGADSESISIQDGIKYYNAKVGGNMPVTRKNVWRNAATEPWGAYYRDYYGSSPGLQMTFQGPAEDGVPAIAGAYEWYSALGNMLDIDVARQVTIAPGDTLTFQTWYDIEDQWDYGYVEGSADGEHWVKLDQVSGLPAATANLNGSTAWDGPGGLTGNSGGWQTAEYDFGDLSGTVWVRFRYVTDEAANGTGWYVDDVRAGAYVDDDTESGWTSTGFLWTTGLQANDWTADAYVPKAKTKRKPYAVVSIVATEGQGLTGSAFVATQYTKRVRITAVMSNRPDGVFSSIGRLVILKHK